MTTDLMEATVVDVDLSLEAEDEEPCWGPGCRLAAVKVIVNDPCGCRFPLCQRHIDKEKSIKEDFYWALMSTYTCAQCPDTPTDWHLEPLR